MTKGTSGNGQDTEEAEKLLLRRLQRLEPYAKDSRVAILKDGRELPVSRAGYARLRELME